MVTLRQVAEHAQVSPATVSRVLNEYAHIRPEIRQRVLDSIAALEYKPNRVAQRLRANRSRLVGIMVSDITNPFLNTIMASMEEVFFDNGFSVLMSNTNARPQKEIDYLKIMENEEIAGLVIAPSSENVPRLSELAGDGLPIVVVDRRIDDTRMDMVLSDNVGGAETAVAHLIGCGHKRIGHIGGPLRVTSGRERYDGYMKAMHAAGLSVEPNWIRFGNHQYDGGYFHALELLNIDPPLTALFIENNMMSLGALSAIHERGKRIPDDIALVGFDDIPWAIALNPPLTTVAQPTNEIGQRAAMLLLEQIENPGRPSRTVILPTQLIIRASCGYNRRDDELKRRERVKGAAICNA